MRPREIKRDRERLRETKRQMDRLTDREEYIHRVGEKVTKNDKKIEIFCISASTDRHIERKTDKVTYVDSTVIKSFQHSFFNAKYGFALKFIKSFKISYKQESVLTL